MFKCSFRLTNINLSSVSDFNRFLLTFNIRAAALKHLSMFADDEGTPIISQAIKDKYLNRFKFVVQLPFEKQYCWNERNKLTTVETVCRPIGGSPIKVWSRKTNLFCGAVIVSRPVFYETESSAISSFCFILLC